MPAPTVHKIASNIGLVTTQLLANELHTSNYTILSATSYLIVLLMTIQILAVGGPHWYKIFEKDAWSNL